MRTLVVPLAAAWLLTAAAATAHAQDAATPPTAPALTAGGEVSATASPRDTTSFFNYTGYEHNALRFVRVRLSGEWRVDRHVSLLGEVRGEDTDDAEVTALYMRWRPWLAAGLDVQIGRVPPVVGAYARRAYGRDDLVIGQPLAYQYLTSLRPDALPQTVDDVFRMRGRGWEPNYPIGSTADGPGVPLVSGAEWDTGAQAHWRHGHVDIAGAWTRGAVGAPALAATRGGGGWSGRAAFALPSGITLGTSAARGDWLDNAVIGLAPAADRDARHETFAGADAELGRGHLLIHAEAMRVRFTLPLASDPSGRLALDAWSGFVEARYRFTPRWQAAVHADTLQFADVRGSFFDGTPTPWDAPVDRIEAVVGFRLRRDVDVQGGWQENWRGGGRIVRQGFPALHVLWWF